MAPAYLSVFISSFMPVFFIGIAKYLGGFKFKDNSRPRDFESQLKGKAYFAKCAHDNSWEALAPFAAAVIISIQAGVSQQLVNGLAVSFVVFRFIYGLCYIKDWATARSIFYTFAILCVAGLFILSILNSI